MTEAGAVAAWPPEAAMKRCATGSVTELNTIGIVLVACCAAASAGVLVATISSGLAATSSAA
jgi:hypothetical protein